MTIDIDRLRELLEHWMSWEKSRPGSRETINARDKASRAAFDALPDLLDAIEAERTARVEAETEAKFLNVQIGQYRKLSAELTNVAPDLKGQLTTQKLRRDLKRAEAEIARLRDALQDIADGMGEDDPVQIKRYAPAIARDALEDTP